MKDNIRDFSNYNLYLTKQQLCQINFYNKNYLIHII